MPSFDPGRVPASINARISILGKLDDEYNELVNSGAAEVEFQRLAAEYIRRGMVYVPKHVKARAGIVEKRETKKSTRRDPIYRKRVVALLKREKMASARRVAATLKRSQSQAAEMLNGMAGEGIIERAGQKWRLTNEYLGRSTE